MCEDPLHFLSLFPFSIIIVFKYFKVYNKSLNPSKVTLLYLCFPNYRNERNGDNKK